MTDNDAPMQRMLPCPFCGGNAEYQTNKGPTGELYGWVGCTQCGAASDQCDVRSMQPEEIHPIDAWSARVTSPCDGRTEQLLKDVEGVANLLAQWRTTVMCRFDGSVDGDQWRELNKAFDDLATVRAALRTTPQAKPLDLPAQDEVEVVARAIHEHLSRRDIMQYLDNDEDCRGLATAAIAALDRHRAGDDAQNPFRWVDGLSWHKPAHRAVMASVKLGAWMSAAVDDPAVCDAMKTDILEWFSSGEPMEKLAQAMDALREENARLRGALRDASVSLWWAARQMKGNCNGGAVDAVNLAAEDASSVAALTGRQG